MEWIQTNQWGRKLFQLSTGPNKVFALNKTKIIGSAREELKVYVTLQRPEQRLATSK